MAVTLSYEKELGKGAWRKMLKQNVSGQGHSEFDLDQRWQSFALKGRIRSCMCSAGLEGGSVGTSISRGIRNQWRRITQKCIDTHQINGTYTAYGYWSSCPVGVNVESAVRKTAVAFRPSIVLLIFCSCSFKEVFIHSCMWTQRLISSFFHFFLNCAWNCIISLKKIGTFT